ncbi:MAG: glycosyltransferase [Acidobacteriota bacterium]
MSATRAKPKLLLLTSSFPRWRGDFAGCFVAEFAQAISTDFEINILSPAAAGTPTRTMHDPLQVWRFNYFWPRRAQLLDAAADLQPLIERDWLARLQILPFFLCFFLRALLLARNADIICSHWLLPAGLIGGLLAWLTGKPHIVIEHSGALHLLGKLKVGCWLARLITKSASRLVVVSQQLREQFLSLCPQAANKVEVLPMGIDLAAFLSPIGLESATNRSARQVKKRVLFLGRLVPIKGVEVLLEALAGCPQLDLLIAGDGLQREALEQRARALAVPAQFLGMVTGVYKHQLLKTSDLLVIPSIVLPDGRCEGMPVVCLEAFAAAKPVIASAVGGLSELIIDGETGLLCQPGDSAQLRNAILTLLDDEAQRHMMGERAQQIAAGYDWSIVGAKFKTLLHSVLVRN